MTRLTISRTSDIGKGGVTRDCPPEGCRRHDTHPCGPCDWCDVAVGSDHGDPYVFPAGVAELEHVPFQHLARRHRDQGLEHPIPEYQQAPRRSPSAKGRSGSSASEAPARLAAGTSRGPQRPGPGLAHASARSAGESPPSGWASPTPSARSPARSGSPPATSSPSTVVTASACSSSAWPGRRRRRVVAAARWRHGLHALGDRRARSARSAGSSRSSSSTPGGAPCATPSATAPPAARSSAGPPSRSGSSASCTSPTATRSPSSATPPTCRRPAARSATSPRACCST